VELCDFCVVVPTVITSDLTDRDVFALNSLTYSMQQSPSYEANRFTASQEIPRILGNPKVHYRIHKCPPPVAILQSMSETFCMNIS